MLTVRVKTVSLFYPKIYTQATKKLWVTKNLTTSNGADLDAQRHNASLVRQCLIVSSFQPNVEPLDGIPNEYT